MGNWGYKVDRTMISVCNNGFVDHREIQTVVFTLTKLPWLVLVTIYLEL